MLPRPPISTLFPYTTLFRSAVGAVRIVRASRADGAALEACAIAELCRHIRIFRAAGAGAGGIAGLRHEARDDAMEYDAVVEALAGELLHALDMLRREIGAKQDGNAAVLEVEQHHILQRIGGKARAQRGTGYGGKDNSNGKNAGEHHTENFLFKAMATWAGTKAVTSPPMAAI